MIKNMPIACYAARTKDEAVLAASSSGGVFTELARAVLAAGGVVIGAAWTRDGQGLRVQHKAVETEAELEELRGSKYVVSDMSRVWAVIKNNLRTGRRVLFTGTPCQTAAVRRVFGNDKNLLVVALFCHANVALEVWNKFVAEIERKARSRLVSVKMRDKRRGWTSPTLTLGFENPAANSNELLYQTSYGRAFGSCLSVRECCLKCQFRAGRSWADIMIGDFWGVDKALPDLNSRLGVSAVLIYSTYGLEYVRQPALDLIPVAYDQIVAGNPRIESSPNPDVGKRKVFFRFLKSYAFSRAARIAEVGRKTEWKEYYYLSRPRLVNSVLAKTMRAMRKLIWG